jgi:sulfur carrier protein ThiS
VLGKNIKVTVKFYGYFPQGAGEVMEAIEVPPGTTLKAVVGIFSRKHPHPWRGQSTGATPANREQTYAVMVNGVSIEDSKRSTLTVRGGDRITIFLPIGGG